MKNVLIVNQGLSSNIGDKAIMNSLKQYFESKQFDVSVMGFTQFVETAVDEDGWQTYKQTRRIDLPNILKWNIKGKKRLLSELKKIDRCYDYVVIGGGQLIKTDCYFPYAMIEWAKKASVCSNAKYLIGVGADNSFTIPEISNYKCALKMFDGIVVRDINSKNVLHKIFDVDSDDMPDVAFLLRYYFSGRRPKSNASIVMPYDYNTYKYHFHNKKNRETYTRMWIDIIKAELEKNRDVKLMYTTIEDKQECYFIFDQMKYIDKDRIEIVSASSLSDFIQKMSEAIEIYAGRMHALILGMIAGSKVNPIIVSNKIANFEKEYIKNGYDVNEYALMVKQKLDVLFEE